MTTFGYSVAGAPSSSPHVHQQWDSHCYTVAVGFAGVVSSVIVQPLVVITVTGCCVTKAQ